MDLKVVAVLFLLSAFTISSNEAGIPSCCTSTRKIISLKVLRKVVGWTLQKTGPCDMAAAVLHLYDNRRVCLDLRVFRDLVKRGEKMKTMKAQVRKRTAK